MLVKGATRVCKYWQKVQLCLKSPFLHSVRGVTWNIELFNKVYEIYPIEFGILWKLSLIDMSADALAPKCHQDISRLEQIWTKYIHMVFLHGHVIKSVEPLTWNAHSGNNISEIILQSSDIES